MSQVVEVKYVGRFSVNFMLQGAKDEAVSPQMRTAAAAAAAV